MDVRELCGSTPPHLVRCPESKIPSSYPGVKIRLHGLEFDSGVEGHYMYTICQCLFFNY